MSRTIYKNASGLPNDDQITTARDQALLGMAIQDRFPRYYKYFATANFQFRGRSIRNHNNLLGRVDGIDGIKTGYTRASGFNLVSSLHRGNRYLVAVVLGGSSGGQRDARMRELLEQNIIEASVKRTAPKIAEAADPSEPRAKARIAPVARPPATEAPIPVARAEPAPISSAARTETTTTAAIPQVQLGSTDPIKPLLVKTFVVKPGTAQLASAAQIGTPSSEIAASQSRSFARDAEPLPPPPGARPGILGVLPMKALPAASELTPPASAPVAAAAPAPAAPATKAAVAEAPPVPARAAITAKDIRTRGGWIIQVGAFPDEGEAKERLTSAKSKLSRLLGEADPFTEPVVKGEKTLYRARFAGFGKDQAEAACRALKQSDIACMALKN
jgi:D-alanyl-D-alanine carboxypeptidase